MDRMCTTIYLNIMLARGKESCHSTIGTIEENVSGLAPLKHRMVRYLWCFLDPPYIRKEFIVLQSTRMHMIPDEWQCDIVEMITFWEGLYVYDDLWYMRWRFVGIYILKCKLDTALWRSNGFGAVFKLKPKCKPQTQTIYDNWRSRLDYTPCVRWDLKCVEEYKLDLTMMEGAFHMKSKSTDIHIWPRHIVIFIKSMWNAYLSVAYLIED